MTDTITFSTVQKGDKVYDLDYGWGEVTTINRDFFYTRFNKEGCSYSIRYYYNGVRYNGYNQMLFWNKPKIIEDNTINLKEILFNKDFDTQRDDKETLNKCSKDIQKYINLLALRDQVTKDSRNYTFREDKDNYFIYYSNRTKQYEWGNERCMETLNVYFKTNIDVIKIRDILNEGRFRL